MKCPVIYEQEPEVNIHERSHLTMNNDRVDFSEYEWMGEELEEFDRKFEEQLWEEEFIEACFEEMLDEEEAQRIDAEIEVVEEALRQLANINLNNGPSSNVLSTSKLNPNAPEFIPSSQANAK